MKLALPDGKGGFHLFTNKNLKTGDKVFPLVNGYTYKGQWYLLGTRDQDDEETMLACTGWPSCPHTIMKFEYPDDEPTRVITDHGYSPAKCYFKLIKGAK